MPFATTLNPGGKRLLSLIALFLFGSIMPLLLSVRPAEAQGVFGGPSVNVFLQYDFAGIAGPPLEDGDDAPNSSPDFWDELVYPAVLVSGVNNVEYITYTKINFGDSDGTINNFENTAVAKFTDVETGTYRACIPLAAPIDVQSVEGTVCTDEFSYTEGTILNLLPGSGGLNVSSAQTFQLISAARHFGINEKPCPGSGIGWIICPLAETIFNSIQSLFIDVFRSLLVIDPLQDDAADNEAAAALFSIWNSFRVLATAVFVALFLVAIFGQGLAGFELFSAYDFKKIMPRLILAALGIQLSWYILGFMVDVFNILGGGVRGLILAPVDGISSVEFDASNVGGHLSFFVATGGLVSAFFFAGGVLGLLFLIPILFMNVLMAIIFAVFIMLMRNALIILGIVVSPVAFALWVLPNTVGLFQFWWNTMWRLLLMYPLVLALIASGELMARIVVAGNEGSILFSIAGLVVLFAPFFAIPYTFRVAQNILGSATNNLQGRRKQISERLFGDPEDGGSYRARMANRRSRYRTQRRYNRYDRHFIRAQGRTLKYGKYLPGLGTTEVRKSWKFGYKTSVGQPGIRPGTRYGATADVVDASGRVIKKGRSRESFGSYLASLPRYALRTPGRAWARATAFGAGLVGLPNIDDAMGMRNRESRQKMEKMSKMGSRDQFAHALFGDHDLFTGAPLPGDVIQAAMPFRNDDASVQENMKWLFNKAANIPYRRQLLIDHWMGKRSAVLPNGVAAYSDGKLEPFKNGMIKGVSFGTQKDYRDNKHRHWFSHKRMPTSAERLDGKLLEELRAEDPAEYERTKKNLTVGMGLVRDRNIPGFFGEANNNLKTSGQNSQAAFSGTNSSGLREASNRLHDILRMEATARLGDEATLQATAASLTAAGDVERANKLLNSILDEGKLISGDAAELAKMEQPRMKRNFELNASEKRDAKRREGDNYDEDMWAFDASGELIPSFNAKADRRDRENLNDFRLGQAIRNLSDLRAEMMDVLVQGNTPVDLGDDDSGDTLRPDSSLDQLGASWKINDVAEYQWIKDQQALGRDPSNTDIQRWRQSRGPGGRADYVRRDDIQKLQKEREREIIEVGSTSQISPTALRDVQRFLRETSWINDRDTMERFQQAGLLDSHSSTSIEGKARTRAGRSRNVVADDILR